MRNLEIIKSLSRVEKGLIAGTDMKDIKGRTLTPNSQFFNEDGSYSDELTELIKKLDDKQILEEIKAGIMYYDIRSEFWKENPAFGVIMALIFVKKIQERTEGKNGVILNIGVDSYQKHFEAARVFVDAVLRTGITSNGGAIFYWGVINGGDIRNYSQLCDAKHINGGHWFYHTMSHRKEPFLGAKLGMNGDVYSGSDLVRVDNSENETLIEAIENKNFAEITNKEAKGEIITIGNFLENNIKVIEDLIRVTSSCGDIPRDEILKGISVGVDARKNPMNGNMIDILRALGAGVKSENEDYTQDFSINDIIDPNEVRSDAIKIEMDKSEESGEMRLIIDPDGDRASMTDVNSKGEKVILTGSELLLIAAEQLAIDYKEEGKKCPKVISDMRTGLSIKDLTKKLNDEGIPIKNIPTEAGYPLFMKGMKHYNAEIAVENSCHAFLRPMTSKAWGAPEEYPNYQGGDNAALFLTYLLGNVKYKWEGRSVAKQLDYIRERYELKPTVVDERKPALSSKNDKYKYMIANLMKEIADEKFTKSNDDTIQVNFGDEKLELVSGIHLTNTKTHAMSLVRFSNTGSSFTISGEGYTREELDEMLAIGTIIMKSAVQNLHEKGHNFEFKLKDAEELNDISLISKEIKLNF